MKNNYKLPNGKLARKIKDEWHIQLSVCPWMYQPTGMSLKELIADNLVNKPDYIMTDYNIELHHEKKEVLPKRKWVDIHTPVVCQTGREQLLIEDALIGVKVNITIGGLILTVNKDDFVAAVKQWEERK